jgi:hypothetical protein
VLFSVFLALALFASLDYASIAAMILGLFSLIVGAMIIFDAARAMRNFSAAFLAEEIVVSATSEVAANSVEVREISRVRDVL